MRAVYYVLACRKAAGYLDDTTMTAPENIKMHEELLKQPMSFFESEPFQLESESIAMPGQDVFTDMMLILGEYHFTVDMESEPDEANSEPGEMVAADEDVNHMDDSLEEGDAERREDQEYVFSKQFFLSGGARRLILKYPTGMRLQVMTTRTTRTATQSVPATSIPMMRTAAIVPSSASTPT